MTSPLPRLAKRLAVLAAALLLLDCGLYQGKRQESIERNQQFPFDPKSVDAVILSHAHIDHIGNLPNLHKQGFEGNVYCTIYNSGRVNCIVNN